MRCELEGMLDGLIPASSEQLQSILDEINRLAGFLQGMEDLSRAEASLLSLCSQQLELCHFLQGIAGRYRPLFEGKDVRLELLCAGEISVHADPERLSQIVVNLLGNALQATSAGGRVRLSGEQRNSAVAIIIEDSGCGIAGEELPRIFERFYRGPQGGMGIGLAIVKELVDAHGGSVTVESRVGEGSRFTVLFPVTS
jgi:two-component system sensor histidine kinase BaeS